MYQFEWADTTVWRREGQAAPPDWTSRIPPATVRSAMLLHWEEHCLECAAPECFTTCPLFVRRADGNCARFEYGIHANTTFDGLLDVGADVRFRKWGKLETAVFPGLLPLTGVRRLNRAEVPFARAVHGVSGLLDPGHRRRRLDNAWQVSRRSLLRRFSGTGERPDEFVVECWSHHPESFQLLLEEVVSGATVLRRALEITPGHNVKRLPAGDFVLPAAGDVRLPRLLVYPENDQEVRLVFTWLDFVRYVDRQHTTDPATSSATAPSAPAATVKCVAWDLDNTVWDGTLVENGATGCRPREHVLDVVRALDERGIVQTVVSKNDHEQAWQLVQEMGLGDYLLHPAINWGAKSENLRQVAAKLNIGVDTFALVDDSPFERAEVVAALPAVRVYSDTDMGRLLDLPEFDVPVTQASRLRRQSYRDNVERDDASAMFPGDYLAFLRSCKMRLDLFVPTSQAQQDRCFELVQRTNQLNLSTRRYSRPEFDALLLQPDTTCIAVECSDRFGHYGIVGFASVRDEAEGVLLHDFVLSCRVARKRVEHSLFRWLASTTADATDVLRVAFRPTERNGPLAEVLEDFPFSAGDDGVLHMPAARGTDVEDVNTVVDRVTA